MSAHSDYRECEEAVGDLQQGDVIKFHDSLQPFRAIGIVITADCDIDKDKHGGILSYVPVLSASDYVSGFFLQRKLDEVYQSVQVDLLRLMRQAQRRYAPQFPTPLSDRGAIDWLRRSGGEGVANDLSIPAGKELSAFNALADVFAQIDDEIARPSRDRFQFWADIAVALGRKKSVADSRTQIGKEVIAFLKKPPGDALYINSLTSELSDGYVVYLRLVREINDREIELGPSSRLNTSSARRIARLKAPFVYRLTQGVASVFSSIGLPGEYEKARDTRNTMLFGLSGDES